MIDSLPVGAIFTTFGSFVTVVRRHWLGDGPLDSYFLALEYNHTLVKFNVLDLLVQNTVGRLYKLKVKPLSTFAHARQFCCVPSWRFLYRWWLSARDH